MSDSVSNSATISILGAGSWGATLAWLFASSGRNVRLWSYDKAKVERLKVSHRVEKPLDITIPKSVVITDDLKHCVEPAQIIVFACSSQAVRSVALAVSEALAAVSKAPTEVLSPANHAMVSSSSSALPVGDLGSPRILVSAAKGIELHTFLRMSEVIQQILPGNPVCALSGPNLAAEVLRGLPTASVVAGKDSASNRLVQEQMSVPSFRVYTNDDLVAVELGGAFKNIIAIAAGCVDGLELGTNAKAALMTRGLAEMTRLSVALGGRPTTLAGLSGMGDLVATCYSVLSRNYRLGFHLAKGETLDAAEKDLGAVAEGVTTARAVCELSQRLGIELPIAEQVDRTLRGASTPAKAIMTLMARPLASE